MARRYPTTDQAAPKPRCSGRKDSARQASKTMSKLAEKTTNTKARLASQASPPGSMGREKDNAQRISAIPICSPTSQPRRRPPRCPPSWKRSSKGAQPNL